MSVLGAWTVTNVNSVDPSNLVLIFQSHILKENVSIRVSVSPQFRKLFALSLNRFQGDLIGKDRSNLNCLQ